jgi:hypothetical protein
MDVSHDSSNVKKSNIKQLLLAVSIIVSSVLVGIINGVKISDASSASKVGGGFASNLAGKYATNKAKSLIPTDIKNKLSKEGITLSKEGMTNYVNEQKARATNLYDSKVKNQFENIRSNLNNPQASAVATNTSAANANARKVIDTSAVSSNSSWLKAFLDLVTAINASLVNIFSTLSLNAVNKTESFILGDLTKEINNDKLLVILNKITERVTFMTQDPAVQEAIKKLAEQYAILTIQMMDAAKPYIDKITDDAINTVTKVGSKLAVGGVNTGFNIILDMISAVPAIGPLVNIILIIISAISKILTSISPALYTVIQTSSDTVKLSKLLSDVVHKNIDPINENIATINSIQPTSMASRETSAPPYTKELSKEEEERQRLEANEPTPPYSQGGGRHLSTDLSILRKNINTVTLRVKKTINKFLKHTRKQRSRR